MSTHRTIRVAEVIRRELATLLLRELNLDGVLVTITSVEVPPDLKAAHVYISVLGKTLSREDILKALQRHRPEWQSEVGRRLGSKSTPKLIFKFDDAVKRGDRVLELLTELGLEEKPSEE